MHSGLWPNFHLMHTGFGVNFDPNSTQSDFCLISSTLVFSQIFILILYTTVLWTNFYSNTIHSGFWPNFHPNSYGFWINVHPNTTHSS